MFVSFWTWIVNEVKRRQMINEVNKIVQTSFDDDEWFERIMDEVEEQEEFDFTWPDQDDD